MLYWEGKGSIVLYVCFSDKDLPGTQISIQQNVRFISTRKSRTRNHDFCEIDWKDDIDDGEDFKKTSYIQVDINIRLLAR